MEHKILWSDQPVKIKVEREGGKKKNHVLPKYPGE